MKHYLLLLLATAGLLTAGCGEDEEKKNDPTPSGAGILTYTLNGAQVSAPASIVLSPKILPNEDWLDVVTNNGAGPDYILVTYKKGVSSPVSSYTIRSVERVTGGNGVFYSGIKGTISQESDGSYSGTFSGSNGSLVISAGTFTKVKP